MSKPPPARYRTTNWSSYNASLRRRGSLLIWVDKDMTWRAPREGRPGRPAVFSDAAIQFCLSIKILFKLPLRQTAGMVASLLRLAGLAGLDWPVPDFSTLCRRQKTLAVQVPYRRADGPLNLLVDSTGIKFLGDGEWQARKHGAQGRRQWRKVHLAMDPATSDIRAVEFTPSRDGEVYAVARYSGVKAKDVAAKLGDPQELRSVEQVKADIASSMTARLQEFIKQAERDAARRSLQIAFRKAEMIGRHREERCALSEEQEQRWQVETRQQAERLPKGFSGIWHRLTGKYAKVKEQNERKALNALHRDRAEKDALILRQIEERQAIQRDIRAQREAAQEELLRLREDVAHYMRNDRHDPDHTPMRKREKKREDDDRKRERAPCPHRRRGFEP